jgi:D-alanyl-D-alanine dipeptidase
MTNAHKMTARRRILNAVLWAVCSMSAPISMASSNALIDAGETVEGVVTDIRYAGKNNFLGRPVAGYSAAKCWLSREATSALSKAQHLAENQGLAILIYDCYRPQRAVDDFVRWVSGNEDEPTKAIYYPNVPRRELIDRGYIASRSGHSRGSTIDVTVIAKESGQPVAMGTPWDYFDARSHTTSNEVNEAAIKNRQILQRIMESAGFRGYYAEWWHFTLESEPFPDTYFDIPIQ